MLSFFRQLGRFSAAERWWIRIGGWALTGLAAGFVMSLVLPAHYTAEATVRLVPAMISQDLVPHDTIDVGRLLEMTKPTALSRNVIITMIINLNLYPGERTREPMEDVVEEFRKAARIDSPGEKVIRVAFTYSDPVLANKVTQELVSRLITQNIEATSTMAVESYQFFKDEADTLGNSWLRASAIVKATPSSDARYDLLVLERDQQRKEYEAVAQKLGTVQILKDLASRGQDVKLELLDAASLPQQADLPLSLIRMIGLGCGLAVGLMSILWRALRRTPPAFSIPAAQELA